MAFEPVQFLTLDYSVAPGEVIEARDEACFFVFCGGQPGVGSRGGGLAISGQGQGTEMDAFVQKALRSGSGLVWGSDGLPLWSC